MSALPYVFWTAFLFGLIIALAWAISKYLFAVYTGKKGRLDRLFDPIDKAIYKIIRADPSREMSGKEYFIVLLVFSAFTVALCFIILLLQGLLPLNPQHFAGLSWDLALHTALSFATNTDLQHYAGETALSYLSQMMALQFLEFTSAAIGLCAAVAVFRGFSGKFKGIGNFYYDFVRSVTRVMLPLSAIAAIVLVASGLPQTLGGYVTANTIGGGMITLPVGPVASMASIEQLGTNGGGYYGANFASPYQDPSPFTNWFEFVLMLVLVTSMPFLFGSMVGNRKEGRTLLIATYVIFGINIAIAFINFTGFGPYMEARLGAFSSVLWTAAATSTMTGSLNASLSAFSPFVIISALLGMFIQAAPGGLGGGVIYLLMYVVIAVFIVGLMAGRTPEYLGAKIIPQDVKRAVIAFISHPLLILIPLALAFSTGAAAAIGSGAVPNGYTQVLYEFASAAANNGSDFLGASANTLFFNISTGIVVWFGRFISIAIMLIIADSMSKRQRTPETGLRTDNMLFVAILVGSILLLAVLTFMPFIVLGPVLSLLQGFHAI
jgi:K+-transporting ATPase ATPase A chain